MRTAEEQYQKQFNEIRQRWKRDRRRRALGMLITGVIGAIAALISHFFFNAAKYEPWNYIVVLCGIALCNSYTYNNIPHIYKTDKRRRS